jgi:hypothetical protein
MEESSAAFYFKDIEIGVPSGWLCDKRKGS